MESLSSERHKNALCGEDKLNLSSRGGKPWKTEGGREGEDTEDIRKEREEKERKWGRH